MNKSFRLFAGLAISGFCVWFVFRGFDGSFFVSVLNNIQWHFVLIAVVIYLFGHLLRSFRWRIILSPLKKVSVVKLFAITMFGFLANSVLPARAGEFAKGYALKKEAHIDLPACLSSIAVDRMFDVIGFFSLIFCSYQFVPKEWIDIRKGILLLTIAIAGVLSFFLLMRWLSLKTENKILGHIHGLGIQMKAGLKSLSSIKMIATVSGLTVLIVACEVLNIFVLGQALNLSFNLLQSAAILLAIVLGVAIPAAPGSIGTFELFSKQLMMGMAYAPSLALSFLLFLHAYYLLINCSLGLMYFLFATVIKKDNVPLLIK